MFLVWVRRVLSDTTSWRAISGPSRSVPSSRSTSSSRSLSGSIKSCVTRRSVLSLAKGRQESAGILRDDPSFRGRLEQGRHRRALVHKDADVALRLGQRQCALQRHKRSRDVALHLVTKRLQHQDFDDTAGSRSVVRGAKKPLQQSHRVRHGAAGEKHPGKGDVLELAQVAEVVCNGQPPLTRPAKGFIQPPLRDPHPRLHCRDRTHVGKEVAHVQALCLLEQVERAVQISLSLAYASHGHAPAIRVLRQPGVLAQLLARQQVLRGRLQIVTLAVEFAHADVHVSRSPQHRRALLRRKLQCLLVGAHRLAETTLRNPDIGQER